MASPARKVKKDPFKTRKTSSQEETANDTLTPPDEVAKAIDAFRECQEQAKHFEGEATIHKDAVLRYARESYSQRVFKGQISSFKVMGQEALVTFVAMDSSAGLTDEDVAIIDQRWGSDAASEPVERDFRSLRFDAKVLEANFDQVVNALQKLPEDVLDNLFKPMLMKATEHAVEKAKRYAKTPEDMEEMLRMLKMKNYSRPEK